MRRLSLSVLGFQRPDEVKLIYRTMKPLTPLRLSPIMAFAVVGIVVLVVSLWLNDRTRLAREIEWLRYQIAHPEKLLAV
jgi:hypothetical protein